MNKTRCLISLVLALAATFVALRHRTLRHLETEQSQLRQQIQAATEVRADIAQKKTAPPASTNAVLSTTEHRELLRLRNEIGQLRGEMAAESNRMVIQMAKQGDRPVPTSDYTPAEGEVTRVQENVKYKRGRSWGLALIKYANANGDELPATLADAARFISEPEGADDFELLVSGRLSAIKSPGRTIALREKRPWKLFGNQTEWRRIYVFADGQPVIYSSATEDFTESERQMAQNVPPSSQ